MNQVQKKYVILGSLCALVLTLAVGYAAFQAVLKINGTTNISSDWDVRITNIEKTASLGSTDNEGSPTYDNTKGLSATFNTNLTSPGDYATYKITITNNGSLDAVLKTITIPENTNNDIIFYLNKDQSNSDIAGALKQNATLTKSTESNNVGYVYVTVLYRNYANQQTATTKTASMTVTFDFEQKKSGGSIVGPSGNDFTGTVYRWSSDELFTGDNIAGTETTIDPTAINQKCYLKHDVVDNKIIASYVCFITDTEHCMKGGDNGAAYEENKTILQTQELWFANNGGSCENHYCSGGEFTNVYPTSTGTVRASNSSIDCSVSNDGYSSCK